MATMLLSIVAAGVLIPYTTGATVQVEGTRRTLASKLASDLMEKILMTPFDSMAADYGSYTEAEGQVKDMSGVVFSGLAYSNFSREASCVYVYVPQESGSLESKFILAEVGVYYNGEELVSLKRLISR